MYVCVCVYGSMITLDSLCIDSQGFDPACQLAYIKRLEPGFKYDVNQAELIVVFFCRCLCGCFPEILA